jgi:hypothetical protein
MSNKIDNNFGAGSSGFDSPEKKPREQVGSGKNFGDLLKTNERDGYRSQSRAGEENEADSDYKPFESLFGRVARDDYEQDDSDNPGSSSSTRRPDNRPRTDRPERENKPEQKSQPKPKRVNAKGEGEEIEEKKEEKKPEIKQPDQLAPFQVPMQVDPIRSFGPVEKKPPVMAAHLIDQIVQEVRLGINARGEAEFQFDLKSDVLEGLKLKISTKDGRVSASFIAENVHVKDTIDQGAQELLKALQARGLEVANFEVSVGADTSGSGQDRQQNEQQSYGPRDSYSVESGRQSGTAAAETERTDGTKSSTDYTI